MDVCFLFFVNTNILIFLNKINSFLDIVNTCQINNNVIKQYPVSFSLNHILITNTYRC